MTPITTLVPPIRSLKPVALLDDALAHGLARGQVGTVVELLDDETVEVEFTDENGVCCALVVVQVGKLLPLLYGPHRTA